MAHALRGHGNAGGFSYSVFLVGRSSEDCIVRRWQDYTGGQAVLETDSRTFDDLARERVGAVI